MPCWSDWPNIFPRQNSSDLCSASAQDAFVPLLLRPRGFDSPSGARAYLRAMGKGLCIDLWRRREVEQAWLAALTQAQDVSERMIKKYMAQALVHCALLEADFHEAQPTWPSMLTTPQV